MDGSASSVCGAVTADTVALAVNSGSCAWLLEWRIVIYVRVPFNTLLNRCRFCPFQINSTSQNMDDERIVRSLG
jgi:hypothetical protein